MSLSDASKPEASRTSLIVPRMDAEVIRCRPRMFIGDTYDGSGIYQLIWAVLKNSLQEHLAGACQNISIAIAESGAITVEDDGPGMSLADLEGMLFPEHGLRELQALPSLDHYLARGHVGSTEAGLFVVNALTAWTMLDIFRDGHHYRQRFERGFAVSPLEVCGSAERSGTRVSFLPDPLIFGSSQFDLGVVSQRLKELAYLCPKLRLKLSDQRLLEFCEPRGIVSLLECKRARGTPLAEPLVLQRANSSLSVELAIEWLTDAAWSPSLESYANVVRTSDGGSHVDGLLAGLVKGFRAAAETFCRKKSAREVKQALLAGINAVVCVRLEAPEYGPTKTRLLAPSVKLEVRELVASALPAHLRRHPELLKWLRDSQ